MIIDFQEFSTEEFRTAEQAAAFTEQMTDQILTVIGSLFNVDYSVKAFEMISHGDNVFHVRMEMKRKRKARPGVSLSKSHKLDRTSRLIVDHILRPLSILV